MTAIIAENVGAGLIASAAHGVIGLLLCRIKEEIKLAWGFQTELEALQRQVTRLSALLKGASGQPITNPLMLIWLKRIKDAAENAEDLIDEWSYEALKGRIQTRKRDKLIKGVTYPISCFVMAHKVRDFRKLFGDIWHTANKLKIEPLKVANGDVYNDPYYNNQDRRLQYQRQCVGDELLLGRDEDIIRLVNLLCDPTSSNSNLNVIGIVGMAGLGKTALSKKVSKVQEVTNFFNSLVIWLAFPHSFDLIDTLSRMVEILFKEPSNMKDQQALISKLQEKLQGKRYLLILDDVWDIAFWVSLRSSLHEIGGSKGTTLLVNSRYKNVVLGMKTYCYDGDGKITIKIPSIYSLDGLNDEDSWSLFMVSIINDILLSNERESIAKRMLRNCRGVPLAIQALGDLLSDRSIRWNEIERSDSWTNENDLILPSLKLSYDYLPNVALKKCFSYCAIFGEDEVIEKDHLIYMWMAHGFLQPYDEMELIGEEYFNILLNSSFFQEVEVDVLGNVKTFKMHNLVLSLARDVSTMECLCLNKPDESSEVRHVSPSCSERKLILTSCKKFRTCLTNEYIHSLDYLLDCRNLRVLSFRISQDESMEWDSLCSLKHLRYLRIVLRDYSRLQLPEQIAKLYHLQTLWITPVSFPAQPFYLILPKDIGNLMNLRHIRVDHGAIRIPAAGLGHLTALQTLPAITLNQDWGMSLREIGMLTSLSGTLEIHSLGLVDCQREAQSLSLGQKSNLERLVLKWDQSSERHHQNDILEVLQPHENLAILEINAYCGTRFPCWLIDRGSPLQNLVSLKLLDCVNADSNLKLENFRYLRFLSVKRCINLTISFPIHGFQCCNLLEALEVDDCDKFENIPDLTPLTKLRALHISVNHTTTRCELVGLGSLPCLTELRTNLLLPEDLGEDSPVCKSLHSLSLATFTDDYTRFLPVQLQHLVELQDLKISNYRSVETLPDWLRKLTSLKELRLDSMPELKFLPSLDVMLRLTNLQTFSTYDCPVLSNDLRNQSGEWYKIGHIRCEIWDNFELIPGFFF